jgi:Tol biopolymer transport system component
MIGSRLAHFQITNHLGSGGMGDVYQATDTKLGRSVAVKLLPEAFARETERVARFEREARVLAALNHSNIAAIHGLEQAEGRMFLVMELVPGETLAERIRKGAIPAEEALGIARQIAEALEAAHAKGVIHRDLKPANVKVTPDGRVKVLDFGLAKAYQQDSANADLGDSPTITAAATMPGMVVGTAAYMSPEQAKGKEVDARTDIFAFGCVLYEMLTGKRAFDGKDVSERLASVLAREPDWTRLPEDVSRDVRKLLRLCLEKNGKNRLNDATALRLLIEQAAKEPVGERAAPQKSAGRLGWIAAAILLLALASLAVVHFRETPTIAPEMRVEISTPATSAPMEFALSPNGRHIVFAAAGDGPQRLWLRALDSTEAQPMAGTEGADYSFWSPESRSIGFFAGGKLKRVDIAGGPPQVIADAPLGRGGTWNADGTILFAPTSTSPLSRVAAAGGEAVAATRLDPPRQTGHVFPRFLPDGRHFLFYAVGSPETAGVYLGSLDSAEGKRLAAADMAAQYHAPDTVVFMRGSTLLAQHLDVKKGVLTGDPVTVVSPVGSMPGFNYGGFSTSNGALAYRTGAAARQLTWMDRTGKTMGAAGEPESTGLLHPELSPDGRRVAVYRNVQNNGDIWLLDLLRVGFAGANGGAGEQDGARLTRFTFDPGRDTTPVWSPDGERIAFASTRSGVFNLYLKPSNRAGAEEPLLETPNPKYSQDWSKNGRFLLYSETGKSRDLWALPLTGGDKKPFPIANTPFDELNGQISPGGDYVAYETNESGRFEIVVQAFPNPSGKWQVSVNGGIQPRWRADGNELYFIAPGGKMMASSIAATGGVLTAATPVALFPTRLPSVAGTANKQQYAVSKDGHFLLNQVLETANTPITLILNWRPKP